MSACGVVPVLALAAAAAANEGEGTGGGSAVVDATMTRPGRVRRRGGRLRARRRGRRGGGPNPPRATARSHTFPITPPPTFAPGALAGGSLSTVAVAALGIGGPPHGGWRKLPLFAVLCAASKLATVPLVLLLLRLRESVADGAAAEETGGWRRRGVEA